MSNDATKFHPDVFWPHCNNVQMGWYCINFFYRSSLFCFFLENFRFEQYANIILATSQCIMYFKTSFQFGKMSNKITNAICQLTNYDLLYVSATFGNLTWIHTALKKLFKKRSKIMNFCKTLPTYFTLSLHWDHETSGWNFVAYTL